MKRILSAWRLLPVLPLVLALAPVPASAAATAGPSAYTALNPVRVIDTRPALTVPGRGTIALSFSSFGVPSSATAVALNATATNGAQAGYASLYPSGGQAGTSVLNWVPGQTVANLAVVALGSGGQVTLFNGSYGPADFVIDLQGYFAPPSGTAGQLVPVSSFRLADTRPLSGSPYAGRTLGSGSVLTLQVTGAGGIPATGVSAVVLNLTSTGSTTASYFSVWPAGWSQPLASNLNFAAGDTKANRVIVPVGAGGQINLFNRVGTANAVVDVSGYFTDASGYYGQGGWFTPIQPVRLLDTRAAGSALGPGGMATVQAAGVGGIVWGALATFLNLTVTNTFGGSYLTVFSGGQVPNTSDLNWDPTDVNSNAAVAQLSSGGSHVVYNAYGWTDVVVDAFGFFTRSAAPYTPPYVPPSSSGGFSVAASPTSIPADGTSSSTVTATLKTLGGTALPGKPVMFSVSPSTCGTFTPDAIGDTDAAGQFTAKYIASTTPGSCVVTALEAYFGQSAAVVITQTIVPNTVTVNVADLAAGGSSTPVTVAVKKGGTPLTNVGVSLSLSGYPAGACGSLAVTSGTTGPGASFGTAYFSGSAVGFCQITAVESATGASGSHVVTETTQPASSTVVGLGGVPATIVANGTATSAITATVAYSTGGAIVYDPVAFSLSGTCGRLSSMYATTDASGHASVTYTAGTTSGKCSIGLVEAAGAESLAQPLVIQQDAAPNTVTIASSPGAVAANGTATAVITVTDRTVAGLAADGDTVELVGTGTCGTLNPTSLPIAASGNATSTYTASHTAGFCTITATSDSAGGGSASIIVIQMG